MIVELPKDEEAANRVIHYIKEKGVNFHEIERKGAKI